MSFQYALLKEEYVKNQKQDTFLQEQNITKLRNYLLFYSQAHSWDKDVKHVLSFFENKFLNSEEGQAEILEELATLYIDLSGAYCMWHVEKTIDADAVERAKKAVLALLEKLEASAPARSKEVIEKLTARTINRYEAEKIKPDLQKALAKKHCGINLVEYCKNTAELICSSNLAKISRLANSHPDRIIIGNDFGDFLQETLWLGASFVTTNPPLINAAWALDESYWQNALKAFLKQEQELLAEAPSWMTKTEKLCACATLLVVEKNCKMLRDIFLTAGGETGYCCYQVNPLNHRDCEKMLGEVLFVYKVLQKRLGGIPNVSFKLPGLPAGLKVAERLGAEGISATITLEYGLFQALAFAKIFKESKALINNLVIMNGRIAFPVRDELLESGVPETDLSYRFTGVEITRRLYRVLYAKKADGGLELDKKKVRIMNASLRDYGTDIPDLTELWGSPLITIFPNARQVFDAAKREISLDAVFKKTDEKYIGVLKKSSQFSQAYWYEADGTESRPEGYIPFDIEHENEIIDWPPIAATLSQFLDSYKALAAKMDMLIPEEA
ncbi:hypothetical protein H0R92_06365 [Treponema sp. OMZ 840]|uniref:transaldolase family protein n=1 Tax=Treponema sp. OMZ 840 TaxID=244313 RepID=UPI003D90F781